MKKRIVFKCISMGCIAIAIILMALPFGVAMKFVDNPGPPMQFITFHYSYFSGMPIGYANWFPMLTALLSIAAFVMFVVVMVNNTKRSSDVGMPILVSLSLCILASPLSWVIFNSATIIGVIIFILHIIALALQINYKRKSAV